MKTHKRPSRNERIRRRRVKLFHEQKGRCYWCSCEMTLEQPEDQPLPRNFATIEHLDDRLSGRRGSMPGERTVVACTDCNERRGRDSEDKHIAEHRERSSRAPRNGTRLGKLLMSALTPSMRRRIAEEKVAEQTTRRNGYAEVTEQSARQLLGQKRYERLQADAVRCRGSQPGYIYAWNVVDYMKVCEQRSDEEARVTEQP